MKMKKRTKKNIEQAKKLMHDACATRAISISVIREYLRSNGYDYSKKTILRWSAEMVDIPKTRTSARQQPKNIKSNAELDAMISTGLLEFLTKYSGEVVNDFRKLTTKKGLTDNERMELVIRLLRWERRFNSFKIQYEHRLQNPMIGMPGNTIDRGILINRSPIQLRKQYKYSLDFSKGKRLHGEDRKRANAIVKAHTKKLSEKSRDERITRAERNRNYWRLKKKGY